MTSEIKTRFDGHTPGPWSFRDIYETTNCADMSMIAAAPDLLEELKSCKELLDHLGDPSTIRVLDERNRAMVAMRTSSINKLLGVEE